MRALSLHLLCRTLRWLYLQFDLLHLDLILSLVFSPLSSSRGTPLRFDVAELGSYDHDTEVVD